MNIFDGGVVTGADWMEALEAKNTYLLRLYIEADPDKVNGPLHEDGMVPLHAVGETGHVPTFDILLGHGAEVNKRSKSGCTPLHVAVQFGNASIVSRLLSAGADVNAKTTANRNTPLHKLRACSDSAAIECAMLLINAGARVSEPNNRGRTALFHAVRRGHRSLAKTFMRAGAEALDTSHPRLRRRDNNASALAMVDAVNAAGGWQEFAGKHRRILAGLVAKLPGRSFPLDAASHVVGFWCPPGGY